MKNSAAEMTALAGRTHNHKVTAPPQQADELREVIEQFLSEFSKLADSFDLAPAGGTKFVFRLGSQVDGTIYEVNTVASDFHIAIDIAEFAGN